jgi:hypothetical protein
MCIPRSRLYDGQHVDVRNHMAVRLDMPPPSSRPLLPVGRVDPSRLKCHEIAQQGCRPPSPFARLVARLRHHQKTFSILRVMSANPTDGLDSSSISGSRPVRSQHTVRKLLDADHREDVCNNTYSPVWSGASRAVTPTTTILLLQGPSPIQTLDAACNDDQTVTRTCLPRVAHQQF